METSLVIKMKTVREERYTIYFFKMMYNYKTIKDADLAYFRTDLFC